MNIQVNKSVAIVWFASASANGNGSSSGNASGNALKAVRKRRSPPKGSLSLSQTDDVQTNKL